MSVAVPTAPEVAQRSAGNSSHAGSAGVAYRREIDGLRALAVLPVMFFHAGVKYFRGGFVGVDVFFVISGYLITTILLRELEAGKFSLVRFYERRARRILPALVLVIAACLPFAWLWMMPDALADFSQSLVAVATFVSNVLFWKETAYFAAPNEEKPLIHTWSLAVEEQFYLAYPLLLALAWRLGRRWPQRFLWVVAIGSLGFAEWGWRHAASANFYLIPFRAWELAIGAICAHHLHRRNGPAGPVAESGAVLGLGLIAWAVATFSDRTPFPSVYALIPTLGTALIVLCCRPTTAVGRLLSTRPMVAVGLISYSAYLWHQPVLAFTRIRSIVEPGPGVMAMLAALSLVPAYVSWRWVERPFRQPGRIARGAIFTGAAGVSLVLVAVGIVGYLAGGFPSRLRSAEAAVIAANAAADNNPRMHECRGREPARACTYGAANTVPSLALWGDSHADQLVPALERLSAESGRSFVELAFPGCPPIRRSFRIDQRDLECTRLTDDALTFIRSSPGIRVVLMHAYWQYYIDEKNAAATAGTLESNLEETVDAILATGRQVILVAGVPRMDGDPPRAISKALRLGIEPPLRRIGTTVTSHRHATMHSAAVLHRIATRRGVTLLDPAAVYCDREGECLPARGGTILYRDDSHLSVSGTRLLEPRLRAVLNAP